MSRRLQVLMLYAPAVVIAIGALAALLGFYKHPVFWVALGLSVAANIYATSREYQRRKEEEDD